MERIHKIAAIVVFAFLSLHFVNHFAGLFGSEAHWQFMAAARVVYRYPPVEYAIWTAFGVLILTGLPLIWEIWTKPKDFVHQLQAASGLVLALFVVAHVAWLVWSRQVAHADTDFGFVSQALTSPKWHVAAFVFYGAGLGALFLHAGCILYGIYKKTNKPVGWVLMLATLSLGGYVTWLLLTMYTGHLAASN